MGRNLPLAAAPGSSLAPLLDALQEGKLGRQLVYSTSMPSTPPRYGELDPPLPPAIAQALARSGVARLWSHQAAGIAAVRRGEDVLITTPTASGKSLVFQVPPLEAALRNESGHALFLFPLKALGQDQRGKLQRLAGEAGLSPEVAGCEIYDGDTPPAKRAAIRKNFPRVLVSNPGWAASALSMAGTARSPTFNKSALAFCRTLYWSLSRSAISRATAAGSAARFGTARGLPVKGLLAERRSGLAAGAVSARAARLNRQDGGEATRSRSGYRPNRIRKVDDPRRDDRQDQPRA